MGDSKSPFDDLKSDNGSHTSYMQAGGNGIEGITNVTFGIQKDQNKLDNSDMIIDHADVSI